jgi:hypothetical protein
VQNNGRTQEDLLNTVTGVGTTTGYVYAGLTQVLSESAPQGYGTIT